MRHRTNSRPEAKKRRFAFVVNSDSPIASWSVLDNLKVQFPDHAVDLFHVSDALKSSRSTLSLAVLETLARYPRDIALKRKALRNAVFRSTCVARFVRDRIVKFVHPGSHDFVFQMQSLWSARVPGLPHFLYTDHTNLTHLSYPLADPGALYDRGFLAREAEVYRNASAVFTRSQNVTRDVIERYGAEPARVLCVYAGANTESHEGEATRQPSRIPEGKIILFVGKDWERKGGPDLVRAFEIVRKRCSDATLVVIGCEPDGLRGKEGVEVLGRLPNDRLEAHYRRANLFCMPTLREPFGIVFIEAMSFGLPLVGADIGAIPDFIEPGRNGYLVPPGDPERIAEALLRLLDDPAQCAAFGTRSRELARDRYNWRKVTQRMAERIRQEMDLTRG